MQSAEPRASRSRATASSCFATSFTCPARRHRSAGRSQISPRERGIETTTTASSFRLGVTNSIILQRVVRTCLGLEARRDLPLRSSNNKILGKTAAHTGQRGLESDYFQQHPRRPELYGTATTVRAPLRDRHAAHDNVAWGKPTEVSRSRAVPPARRSTINLRDRALCAVVLHVRRHGFHCGFRRGLQHLLNLAKHRRCVSPNVYANVAGVPSCTGIGPQLWRRPALRDAFGATSPCVPTRRRSMHETRPSWGGRMSTRRSHAPPTNPAYRIPCRPVRWPSRQRPPTKFLGHAFVREPLSSWDLSISNAYRPESAVRVVVV